MKLSPENFRLKGVLSAMMKDYMPGNFGVGVSPLENFEAAPLRSAKAAGRFTVPSRRKIAFCIGRACARDALKDIGYSAVTIDTGASGEPLWPRGCVGSISHTNNIAAAIVALSPPLQGIGIDLEEHEPLQDLIMVEIICRSDELIRGFDPSHTVNLQHGKLLFVIKEAVYKLYWPLTMAFLDFQDIRVTVDISAGIFNAELVNPMLPKIAEGRWISGHFAKVENLYVALALSCF